MNGPGSLHLAGSEDDDDGLVWLGYGSDEVPMDHP
jgi:hypothetical protein